MPATRARTKTRRGRPAAADLHVLPPGAAPDAQVALTLREVCGLTTEEIAARVPHAGARRSPSASCAPRRRSATRGIPVRSAARQPICPSASTRCCASIYLVFNEGYAASSGESLTRHDLSGEAIRLGRLLVELLPEPEAMGLLALMLLHESRRAARTSPTASSILLDDQDRSLWNREQIAEGAALVRARARHRGGSVRTRCRRRSRPCTREAPTAAATDWAQIVALVRRAAARRAVADRRAEPRGRRRDARRPGGGPGTGRCASRTRRADGLPVGPCGTRGPEPAARSHVGSAGGVRARTRS